MTTLDVFDLRESVVSEYRDYVQSFVQVLDSRIDEFVSTELGRGALWPDAALQLNPAFEMDKTLGELADDGAITTETARFFGESIRIYKHQREAVDIGLRGESYVVTTGTGSGKSLTYLIPIYDAIIRNSPERHSVRALLIYPMNALINSQLDALQKFKDENYPDSPIRFGRYTGQEREDDRERILEDPPHILLTNYVMAEYMLVRPHERPLLQTTTTDLSALVMDELHFYRGRQGADVAMLTRRLQERAGKDLQAIATSATIVTGGSREDRKSAVAELASGFFGLDIPATNVVDETLRSVAEVPVPQSKDELRAAVEAELPAPEASSVKEHPLTAWAEEAFGLGTEDGRLIRRAPETFNASSQRLSDESGLPREQCGERLRGILEAGNKAIEAAGQPLLAFRLHQWLSSGSSVYATLEDSATREFRMEGLYKADEERTLYPLAFCRECGQDYYLVSLIEQNGQETLIPRSPIVGAPEEDIEGEGGFFALEDGDLWEGEDDDLPENWFNERRRGRVIKPEFAKYRPARRRTDQNGTLDPEDGTGVVGWLQPRPFLICLRCRAVYDRRQGDYRRLSSLSQTGRSTATTIAVNAAVSGMVKQGLPSSEAKALSFTDNRQDASLQAGHLNDFTQVALIRSGVVEALRTNGDIGFDELGQRVFEALMFRPSDFLREAVGSGPGFNQGRNAMINLLEYRVLEDLSRGWRINQPNLEQTGLLRIRYEGLAELVADESLWGGMPAIAGASAGKREEVLSAFLDHLRMNLAIDAEPLTEDSTRRVTRNASQWLRDPWRLEVRDRLQTHGFALLPDVKRNSSEDRNPNIFSLGPRSAVARFLRSAHTWESDQNLTADQGDRLIAGIITSLRGHMLTVVPGSRAGEPRGVRLLAAAMRWTLWDGSPARPDPVRSRSLHLRREIEGARVANSYFTNLYTENARQLSGALAAEHTGQVAAETRAQREQLFRNGDLSALFCSPTMELGVDISDLDAVHLRNVPPTPANYAQRSGRAGRGGRPALIVAFASQGNAHDQYYFGRRNDMIAGAVAPARMDLRNQDLIRAHLYATWLSTAGILLGNSMRDILDLAQPGFPIRGEKQASLDGLNRDRIFQDVVSRSQEIVKRTQDIRSASWFSNEWIEETIRAAPAEFDRAFNRWREMYLSACALRDAARRAIDDPSTNRRGREEAESRETEAYREIRLLLNETNRIQESDFYPYRYLAGEGFLPGYNFPRLPVRTTVLVGENAQMIDRPRFLGLSEFGPGNQIYHEGRKHRVFAAALPPAGVADMFMRARLCRGCGYAHEGYSADSELCGNCGIRLDESNSDFPQQLLAQPMMRARPTQRISSEEEERVRNGYHVTTHFNFSDERRQNATVQSDGKLLMEAVYAPAARVWRINHGWRQGEHDGFIIDPHTGQWARRSGTDDGFSEEDPDLSAPISGVKPYVRDFRNILLMRPMHDDLSEEFQKTLLFAIKRALQFEFQVEEQEIEAELIGEGEYRRLLFWEAAEGGIGVWERLINDPNALARVAWRARQLCHFAKSSSEDVNVQSEPNACAVACYECLLSYSNQPDHRHIDRRLIAGYLGELESARTLAAVVVDQEEEFRRLAIQVDESSPLELEFLKVLLDNHLLLPDRAQHRPSEEVFVQPDFYYERQGRPGVCVFIDGTVHDDIDQREEDANLRSELQDLGFRVVSIRYDCPLLEQVREYPDVFTATS